MLASLGIVLPVFGLIGVGYLARQTRLVTDRAGDGLSEFVFALAVPCLIFRTLASAEIPPVQPWGYWISYFAGVAVVWAPGDAWSAGASSRVGGTAAVVAGFAAGQANTVLVGIPMILKAYGERGRGPALPPDRRPSAGDHDARDRCSPKAATPRRSSILSRLVHHPIIVAILLGLGLPSPCRRLFPAPLWQVVELIGNAAFPCSLVGMGIALRRYGFEAGWRLPRPDRRPEARACTRSSSSCSPRWSSRCRAPGPGSPCCSPPARRGINAYLFAERYGEGVADRLERGRPLDRSRPRHRADLASGARHLRLRREAQARADRCRRHPPAPQIGQAFGTPALRQLVAERIADQPMVAIARGRQAEQACSSTCRSVAASRSRPRTTSVTPCSASSTTTAR